jgi:hypothetical protein
MTFFRACRYISWTKSANFMYAREKGKRTFMPATPEYQRLRHRKPWLSVINIVVVLAIWIALTLVFLILLGKTPV